jgi:hypothetical protein
MRFSIRDVLWLTIVVALGTVLAIEHWPDSRGSQFSQDELDVYGAALRHALAQHPSDGLIFVDLASRDPPPEFTGHAVLSLSKARVEVGCDVLVADQWGWGHAIILGRKYGEWHYESTAKEWDL